MVWGIERFGPSVDVQENVVARVVEQVEQSAEHRGLIVGNDEIGVFHRERFFKRRRVKESLRLLVSYITGNTCALKISGITLSLTT